MASRRFVQKLHVFCMIRCIQSVYYVLTGLDSKLLNATATFLWSSSKNIKLVKFLSHRKYLPTLCSAHTSASLTPFHPFTCVCVCLSVYVGICERERLHSCMCVCVCAWVCVICPITAAYSIDFSHGTLVYLLYLQYNASVNISNFETQVSISRLAVVGACSCVCSARCREEMNTKEMARL